jgi:trimeric autotransporter adhesin
VSKSQFRTRRLAAFVAAVLIALAVRHGYAAPEHIGQVTFNGVAVPGVTVTATRADQKVATTTNQQGLYRFADLADGPWSFSVAMVGFAPVTKDVTIAADAQPVTWELTLLPFAELAKTAQRQVAPPPTPSPTAATNGQARPATQAAANNPNSGFRRTDVAASAPAGAARPAAPPPEEPQADASQAADGILINGSVNNGAASPFAQPAAFGNNRRNTRSLYNGTAFVQGGNSVWDARPFSFVSTQTAKPDYNDIHVGGTFGGPLKVPGMLQRRPQLFVGFQRTEDHNATTQSSIVPTLAERAGDFSQTQGAQGNSIVLVDPQTGVPFENNQIPQGRISPQAAALLNLYPTPNAEGNGRNYQAATQNVTRVYSGQIRVQQVLDNRNQLQGTLNMQRTSTDSKSLFGFEDNNHNSVIDTTVQWNRRFNQFLTMRPRYQFTQQTLEATPFFAGVDNISGAAGIVGNDQNPENWGPPSLGFSSGIAGLNDGNSNFNRARTHVGNVEAFWYRGRHNMTIGGEMRDIRTTVRSQQNPRGNFTFNGGFTGLDFADFMLGLPATTSIAFGNADKFYRTRTFASYFNDDLRLSPSFTVMLGARWEYEAPVKEHLGRLVNLDVAPDFSEVRSVVASDPTGPLTGNRYEESLISPDRFGIQPRLAMAWRPVPGSSLVVRASYGMYRNANVYQPIANLLAQQPPLSRTFSVANDPANPVTLANAFTAVSPLNAISTFAVDPDLRVGVAQNWQASVQRDLPASLTVTATYLGTHGTNLLQEILPNSYAPGTTNPCPSCPAGFIYLLSDGTSDRHAGQLQVRRRLRNGLTWTANYALAKAEDNATAFSGASQFGGAIAQNWLDLDSERGPSSFDQRHNLNLQVQYTTGVGVGGGALLSGVKGSLIKGWTVTANMTTGSGKPVTPVYFVQVPGTGVTGALRADLTGTSADDIPDGYYLNPAAYGIPVGHFGNAGRNSARGPKEFSLNLGITRAFAWSQRLNADFRIDATNVLNRVVYTSIDNSITSRQFGLPNNTNNPRQIKTSLRVRF